MSYQALLFCPDDKTARVVKQVLSELEFSIEPCSEPFAAVKRLMAQHFDAIVVDCDNEQNAALLFKSARNSSSNQNSLAVAVVEGQTGVAKAFRIGANLVLTKPINVEQSKSTLRVARGLLRKAEAGKSALSAGATPAIAHPPVQHPSVLPPSAQDVDSSHAVVIPALPKPAAAPFLVVQAIEPPPSASVSGFELEKEPTPQPDEAEAALLESMADPSAGVSNPSASSGGSKEYPWQPVSKPLAEPMASALRRAAEAAGKTELSSSSMSQASPVSVASQVKENYPQMGSGSAGAASAPAPAKEIAPAKNAAPSPVADQVAEFEPEAAAESVADDPSLSSRGETGRKTPETGSSNKLFLIVALLLLVAAAGYYGWTKMNPAPEPSPSQISPLQQSVAPAPKTQTSAATPASATVQPSSGSSVTAPQGTPSGNATPLESPGDDAAEPGAKTPATLNGKTAGKSTAKEQEPLVVKNETTKTSRHRSAEAEVAPPALNAAASADENAIAGIAGIASAPVSVPKAPQTVKLSQGVSQGLLMKRVQPVYPPQAMQIHKEGAVQLQAIISKTGDITSAKLLNGDPILAHAALDAVKQWKYKPYLLNGEPVEIQTQITVNFKLP